MDFFDSIIIRQICTFYINTLLGSITDLVSKGFNICSCTFVFLAFSQLFLERLLNIKVDSILTSLTENIIKTPRKEGQEPCRNNSNQNQRNQDFDQCNPSVSL